MALKKLAVTAVASLALAGGVGLTLPASASTHNGRSCYVHKFGFGDYKAMKSYDGGHVWAGKARFFRSTAQGDCRQFVYGF